MPTASPAGLKFYCEMHGPNRTHNTKDCFELNRRAKRKMTKALKNPGKIRKRKRQKIDSSDEESDPKVNVLAAASDNDSDSDTSRVPSEDSKSDNK
eukprot:5271915-Ditylum_brightwellii.AAC.1